MPPIYLSILSNCFLPAERRNRICCWEKHCVSLDVWIQVGECETHNILHVTVPFDLLTGKGSSLVASGRVLNLARFAEDVSIERQDATALEEL